jgi:hypothetical protein
MRFQAMSEHALSIAAQFLRWLWALIVGAAAWLLDRLARLYFRSAQLVAAPMQSAGLVSTTGAAPALLEAMAAPAPSREASDYFDASGLRAFN